MNLPTDRDESPGLNIEIPLRRAPQYSLDFRQIEIPQTRPIAKIVGEYDWDRRGHSVGISTRFDSPRTIMVGKAGNLLRMLILDGNVVRRFYQ